MGNTENEDKTKTGKVARQILKPTELMSPEDLGMSDDGHTPVVKGPRRGGKSLNTKKPEGSARFLYDAPKKLGLNRIKQLCAERIVDADTGDAGWYIWYHTEGSKTVGKEEIVKFNAKTEEEFTLGYDFTIPWTASKWKELLKNGTIATQVYMKDGTNTLGINHPELFTPETS